MYFLRIGVCEVLVHSALVNKLYAGAGFGEVGMVMGFRRTSTVQCYGICELSVLSRESLDRLIKVGGWVDGWMGGSMGEWVDRWVSGWIDG
jgi:hypothetical protein